MSREYSRPLGTKKPWLVRLILWSGVRERGTCCVLCKVTFTVLATVFALCAARDWTVAGWMVETGLGFDVGREVLDRLLGRPGMQALRDADQRTADTTFMRKQVVLACGVLIPPFLLFHLFGAFYAWGFPPDGQALSGLFEIVAKISPDVSKLVQSAPQLDAGLYGQPLNTHAVVVNSFISFSLMFALLATFFGLTLAARPLALVNARYARRQGSKSFSDHSVILALYLLLLVGIAIDVSLYNSANSLMCVDDSKLCHRSSVSLAEYAGMVSLLVPAIVYMQSFIENGCLEPGRRIEKRPIKIGDSHG